MNSFLSAFENFLSPAAKYDLYNFHRPREQARMVEVLGAAKPRLFTMEGVDEENHLLLLEAACYQASHHGNHWECIRLDFGGYDPDAGTPDTFLDDLLARHKAERETAEKLRSALSGLAVGVKAEMDISTAFALSVTVSGGLRFAELLEAAFPTFTPVRGYPAPGPERLHLLIDILTAKSGVVLYVPGACPIPVTLRRWLVNASKRNERLALAFANTGAGGESEDVLGFTVREHFDTLPLTRAELTAAVDERFSPNLFPPDFQDALLVQSNGIAWRVGEIMKRLMQAGCLEGGRGRPWRLVDADSSMSFVSHFHSAFLEPVDVLYESSDSSDRRMAEFIRLCALFRNGAPAGLICRHLGIDHIEAPLLIESVLARFGKDCEHPLLHETGVFQDMTDERRLQFCNEIGRAAILESFSDEERVEVVRDLLSTFDSALPSVTVHVARLYYELSQHLPDDERGWFRNELHWWVGREETEDLRSVLMDDLRGGKLDPVELIRLVYALGEFWPAYRHDAILRSLEDTDIEIPLAELSNFYNARARMLLNLERIDEAESYANAGLRLNVIDNPGTEAVFRGLLAKIAEHRGDYESALQYAEAAVQAALGWRYDDRILPHAYSDLGDILVHLDRIDDAEDAFLRCLEVREHVFGPDHLDTCASYRDLAEFYASHRTDELAISYAERAWTIVERDAPGTAHAASIAIVLGPLYAKRGDAIRALDLTENAVNVLVRVAGPQNSATAFAYIALGLTHMSLGDHSKAATAFQESLRIYKQALPPFHGQIAIATYYVGKAYAKLGDGRAEEYFEEALTIFAQRSELWTRVAIGVLLDLFGTIRRAGDIDRALQRARIGTAAIYSQCGSSKACRRETVDALLAKGRGKVNPAYRSVFSPSIAMEEEQRDAAPQTKALSESSSGSGWLVRIWRRITRTASESS